MTEADTCREFVTPKLVEAGWSAAPLAIGEQRSSTNGRNVVTGGTVRRRPQRRADYLLAADARVDMACGGVCAGVAAVRLMRGDPVRRTTPERPGMAVRPAGAAIITFGPRPEGRDLLRHQAPRAEVPGGRPMPPDIDESRSSSARSPRGSTATRAPGRESTARRA